MSRKTKLEIEIEDLTEYLLSGGSEGSKERTAVGVSMRAEAVSVPTHRPSELLQAMPRPSDIQGIVPSAKGQSAAGRQQATEAIFEACKQEGKACQ